MGTQRTVNRSLIVHKDLAIGIGNVSQTRGSTASIEHKLELVFIFRTLDEIRSLDPLTYTRVALHTEGPLTEYYFDSTSTASDNGNTVLAPIPAIASGRWLIVSAIIISSIELLDINASVNTTKHAGYMVWDSSLNKPIWSTGNNSSDDWVDANGVVVYTPS